MSEIFNFVIASENVRLIGVTFIRLLLSAVLGCIIGFEREQYNRPAGARTYALVCIGSALVMIISEYTYTIYGQTVEPTRLGAQVISGIGFLGAGTIMKEGFTVRGLTTAAGLWVMSCIGLAAGIGFYSGAIIATALNYFILLILKKFIWNHTSKKNIHVIVDNIDEVYSKLTNEIETHSGTIFSTEILSRDKETTELRFVASINGDTKTQEYVLERIRTTEGVIGIHVE